jgi:hypothetical protein
LHLVLSWKAGAAAALLQAWLVEANSYLYE